MYDCRRCRLEFNVNLSANAWPWPIKLSTSELRGLIEGFSDEKLAEFIAGEIDGDGAVWFGYEGVSVEIAACKNCQKSFTLDVLRRVIAERFNIISHMYLTKTVNVIRFYGENAVKLLRLVMPYLHHPLRRLRAEVILAYYEVG
ncbi:hypothetical protein [Caldivirga sp. MU80]|uniref:hypothetical protein n=1 Tax=Caldivirga sp. MU80 TaxID=1650354 RepID=UPI000B108FDD|nr:hypothetical protein [Caldivirga sp. MU80]